MKGSRVNLTNTTNVKDIVKYKNFKANNYSNLWKLHRIEKKTHIYT